MGSSALYGIASAALTMGLFFVVWWREGPRIEKARALINKGAALIDVDDPQAFERNHVEGAKNIPIRDLTRRAHQIGPVKDPVVIYGRGKFRAARAARELRAVGFHEVLNIGRSHW